jgi:hypothetical protein
MKCSSQPPSNERCFGVQEPNEMEQCQHCLRVYCYHCIQQHACAPVTTFAFRPVPLTPAEKKPWFIKHRRRLTWRERLRVLFGTPVDARFDSPDGDCHAACNITVTMTGGEW